MNHDLPMQVHDAESLPHISSSLIRIYIVIVTAFFTLAEDLSGGRGARRIDL
jgi:hypothetical protein